MTQRRNAVSLRELAFVRDVLIPRAWVQGGEVDELVRLRARIDAIFAEVGQSAAETGASGEAPRATAAD
tara:strand:+ start:716 stop:922 length:207 start_codon:yes stop_codon:yes gene_type:complete